MELPGDSATETAGGYARQQSEDFLLQERKAIAAHLAKVVVVICTAQVFGKPAPRLITREMLDLLPPGAIVIDLAVEQGGNCEFSEPGKWVDYRNVSILGASNLPAMLPADASQLYAHNLYNFFRHVYPPGKAAPDMSDEITRASCVTCGGKVVNKLLKQYSG
jgi:NAD(P) transhydrogenase subunit alpha